MDGSSIAQLPDIFRTLWEKDLEESSRNAVDVLTTLCTNPAAESNHRGRRGRKKEQPPRAEPIQDRPRTRSSTRALGADFSELLPLPGYRVRSKKRTPESLRPRPPPPPPALPPEIISLSPSPPPPPGDNQQPPHLDSLQTLTETLFPSDRLLFNPSPLPPSQDQSFLIPLPRAGLDFMTQEAQEEAPNNSSKQIDDSNPQNNEQEDFLFVNTEEGEEENLVSLSISFPPLPSLSDLAQNFPNFSTTETTEQTIFDSENQISLVRTTFDQESQKEEVPSFALCGRWETTIVFSEPFQNENENENYVLATDLKPLENFVTARGGEGECEGEGQEEEEEREKLVTPTPPLIYHEAPPLPPLEEQSKESNEIPIFQKNSEFPYSNFSPFPQSDDTTSIPLSPQIETMMEIEIVETSDSNFTEKNRNFGENEVLELDSENGLFCEIEKLKQQQEEQHQGDSLETLQTSDQSEISTCQTFEPPPQAQEDEPSHTTTLITTTSLSTTTTQSPQKEKEKEIENSHNENKNEKNRNFPMIKTEKMMIDELLIVLSAEEEKGKEDSCVMHVGSLPELEGEILVQQDQQVENEEIQTLTSKQNENENENTNFSFNDLDKEILQQEENEEIQTLAPTEQTENENTNLSFNDLDKENLQQQQEENEGTQTLTSEQIENENENTNFGFNDLDKKEEISILQQQEESEETQTLTENENENTNFSFNDLNEETLQQQQEESEEIQTLVPTEQIDKNENENENTSFICFDESLCWEDDNPSAAFCDTCKNHLCKIHLDAHLLSRHSKHHSILFKPNSPSPQETPQSPTQTPLELPKSPTQTPKSPTPLPPTPLPPTPLPPVAAQRNADNDATITTTTTDISTLIDTNSSNFQKEESSLLSLPSYSTFDSTLGSNTLIPTTSTSSTTSLLIQDQQQQISAENRFDLSLPNETKSSKISDNNVGGDGDGGSGSLILENNSTLSISMEMQSQETISPPVPSLNQIDSPDFSINEKSQNCDHDSIHMEVEVGGSGCGDIQTLKNGSNFDQLNSEIILCSPSCLSLASSNLTSLPQKTVDENQNFEVLSSSQEVSEPTIMEISTSESGSLVRVSESTPGGEQPSTNSDLPLSPPEIDSPQNLQEQQDSTSREEFPKDTTTTEIFENSELLSFEDFTTTTSSSSPARIPPPQISLPLFDSPKIPPTIFSPSHFLRIPSALPSPPPLTNSGAPFSLEDNFMFSPLGGSAYLSSREDSSGFHDFRSSSREEFSPADKNLQQEDLDVIVYGSSCEEEESGKQEKKESSRENHESSPGEEHASSRKNGRSRKSSAAKKTKEKRKKDSQDSAKITGIRNSSQEDNKTLEKEVGPSARRTSSRTKKPVQYFGDFAKEENAKRKKKVFEKKQNEEPEKAQTGSAVHLVLTERTATAPSAASPPPPPPPATNKTPTAAPTATARPPPPPQPILSNSAPAPLVPSLLQTSTHPNFMTYQQSHQMLLMPGGPSFPFFPPSSFIPPPPPPQTSAAAAANFANFYSPYQNQTSQQQIGNGTVSLLGHQQIQQNSVSVSASGLSLNATTTTAAPALPSQPLSSPSAPVSIPTPIPANSNQSQSSFVTLQNPIQQIGADIVASLNSNLPPLPLPSKPKNPMENFKFPIPARKSRKGKKKKKSASLINMGWPRPILPRFSTEEILTAMIAQGQIPFFPPPPPPPPPTEAEDDQPQKRKRKRRPVSFMQSKWKKKRVYKKKEEEKEGEKEKDDDGQTTSHSSEDENGHSDSDSSEGEKETENEIETPTTTTDLDLEPTDSRAITPPPPQEQQQEKRIAESPRIELSISSSPSRVSPTLPPQNEQAAMEEISVDQQPPPLTVESTENGSSNALSNEDQPISTDFPLGVEKPLTTTTNASMDTSQETDLTPQTTQAIQQEEEKNAETPRIELSTSGSPSLASPTLPPPEQTSVEEENKNENENERNGDKNLSSSDGTISVPPSLIPIEPSVGGDILSQSEEQPTTVCLTLSPPTPISVDSSRGEVGGILADDDTRQEKEGQMPLEQASGPQPEKQNENENTHSNSNSNSTEEQISYDSASKKRKSHFLLIQIKTEEAEEEEESETETEIPKKRKRQKLSSKRSWKEKKKISQKQGRNFEIGENSKTRKIRWRDEDGKSSLVSVFGEVKKEEKELGPEPIAKPPKSILSRAAPENPPESQNTQSALPTAEREGNENAADLFDFQQQEDIPGFLHGSSTNVEETQSHERILF